MLDDGHGFSGQDGLIDPDGGGVNFGEPNVGRDFVTDGDLNDVTRDDLLGADSLDTGLVGADDLAHLRLVLLKSLDGGFRIPLLPNADHGVGDENEQDDERLDEGCERILVLFE